jgi:hypothetical protein
VRIATFSRLVSALLLATVATVGLASTTPAWAVSTIPINPGNVPTTAAAFSSKECDPNLGGGPFPGQDVWLFVLPEPNVQGNFVSLHLNFIMPGGVPTTRDIPLDPNSGIVNNMGTSKAFIRTPAGWTLTDAATTAVITGTPGNNAHFNLTSTCPTGFVPPTGPPTGAPNAGGGGTAQSRSSIPFWMSLAAAGILAPVAFVLIRRRRVTNG